MLKKLALEQVYGIMFEKNLALEQVYGICVRKK